MITFLLVLNSNQALLVFYILLPSCFLLTFTHFFNTGNNNVGMGAGGDFNTIINLSSKQKDIIIPLSPMGVLAPGSAHARPSAQPPIDTSGNFPAHMSAESPQTSPPASSSC